MSERNWSGPYLGFGSLEALAEALRPDPIPEEVGAAEWERIAERIRQEDAKRTNPDDEPVSSGVRPIAISLGEAGANKHKDDE